MILPAWIQIVPDFIDITWRRNRSYLMILAQTHTALKCFLFSFTIIFDIKSWREPRVLLRQRDGEILLKKPAWAKRECTMTHSHFLNLISPKEHRNVSHYANNTRQWLQVTKQLVSIDAFQLRSIIIPQTKQEETSFFKIF